VTSGVLLGIIIIIIYINDIPEYPNISNNSRSIYRGKKDTFDSSKKQEDLEAVAKWEQD
jgi:hypothetical protein